MADEVIEFHLPDVTLGEMVEFEEHADQPFGELFGAANPPVISGRSLAALVWILKRRDNPAFTLENAHALKVGEFELKRV